MFRGHEDDVFKGSQPNLFCNHFYWYDEPEKRWPDKINICSNGPPSWHCSDSYYCNWTNNPQIWSVAWWTKEWVEGTLKKPNTINPFADVEYWTNWDAEAWNTKKWTVAQVRGGRGDGRSYRRRAAPRRAQPAYSPPPPSLALPPLCRATACSSTLTEEISGSSPSLRPCPRRFLASVGSRFQDIWSVEAMA